MKSIVDSFDNSLMSFKKAIYLNREAKGVLLLFGGIYFTIVFCNHYFFRTFCFDYGVYNFAFYDYAHFRISDCPIYFSDNINFLQDHVSFTLMYFIPFYWVFSWLTGTYTLLYIQTIIVLIGGWYVYKLIELKTSSKLLSILALLQYLFIYGRWTMFGADCNFAIIASSVIPVFIYYFEKRAFIKMLIIMFFILTTREDMALWTLFIGLFLLIKYYHINNLRTISFSIIIISIVYFVIVFAFMIPLLETEHKKFSLFNYTALGKGPWEAAMYVINNPIETIKLFFINTNGNPIYDKLKLEFYYVYFLCGGFLLFYRPVYFLLFIPILAKKMLNDEPLRWSTDTYYSVEFISILPLAVFQIIFEAKVKYIKTVLILAVCLGTVFITVYKLNRHKDSSVFWYDDKHAFYKKNFYKSDFVVRELNQHLNQIPSNAVISATGTIVPHLAWRPKIYNFPKVSDAEYIVVFISRDYYPLSQSQFETELDKYKKNRNWKIIETSFPLLILKKEENHQKPK